MFQITVRSRSSRRHPPIQRSVIAFMRGVCTLQSTVRIPAPGEDRVERSGVVRATPDLVLRGNVPSVFRHNPEDSERRPSPAISPTQGQAYNNEHKS
jgi:hypothetical protein